MNINPRYKTYRSALRHFFTIAGSSLLAVTFASAADYYWDTDGDATPGFGSATGTWSSAGTGNTWSTSPTGDGVGGAAVADYITTTADDLYFGTVAISTSGTVTIDGVVNANSVFDGAISWAGTTPTINFSAEGTYTRGNNNNGNLPVMVFTGNGTSLTWKIQRNMNASNVDTTSAGKIILSTASTSTFPYPGRTSLDSSANLGAANAPLVFDDGTLRMNVNFPYNSLSALDADHPVSFVADKDAGFDVWNGDFTVDLAIDLGTGTFWSESSKSKTTILTQANIWGQVNITSGTLEVSDSTHLGPIASPIQFGSGTTDLATGTLRIAGTTFSSFGARPLQTTTDKDASFEIVEAAHTFTVDQALTQGAGDLFKSGAGTLALSGTANTYTGPTNVTAGTLALINGSHASPITVSSGASLGFTIGSGTTSTSTVDLSVGDVTISNPGAVDGSTSYLLMTAAGGFTFTDIATQLGTAVTGYALALQNSDTELWLVPSGSPFEDWAPDAPDELFGDDKNGDGVTNGLAFLLGAANATDDATGLLPTVTEDTGALILTFSMLNADNRGDASLSTQHSSDLGLTDAWDAAGNEETVPDSTSVVGVVDFVITPNGILNDVVATIPSSETSGDELFGRVNAVDGVVVE